MQQNPTGIFIHYLNQLKRIVIKIADHQQHNPALLYTSLHSDMLPLLAQIRTAANFSLRTCCPLARRERINFDNSQETYEGLQQQLDDTIAYLQAIPAADFHQPPERVKDKAGFNELSLTADEYLNCYALPNFFFHLCMVYSIARQVGVPLSKGDFDGYHQYPNDFSFV
ncbi:DUF1993 domain-containing protein [Cellvibrio sp. OA-2007]|uniref:DUF1993 domain-containing protein n=1 Tax=Cellvibrio sp. OA-2007 TaxID=529823 RepID=UPI0007855AD5|nr:DUF1993 domain-containing protein [Cellvibrio sp. OA-2007]